jgi:hypothetical protein
MLLRSCDGATLIGVVIWAFIASNLRGAGTEFHPREYQVVRFLNGLQALANDEEIWFFLSVDLVGQIPSGSGRGWHLSTERYVIRFDGRKCTQAMLLLSGQRGPFVHPNVCRVMRCEDTFCIVSGVSGDGKGGRLPGNIYRWNGADFRRVEADKAARIERACELDLASTIMSRTC